MAGRKVLTYGGLGAIGAGAYYLYNAGGDAKLAEKQFEHDAATAARKVKGDWPGSDKEAKKAGEESYEAVRATAQQYADQARSQAKVAEQKFDAYSADAKKKFEEAKAKAEQEYRAAGKEINAAVNQFDKTVEQKAAETKGWFGGFFGGK